MADIDNGLTNIWFEVDSSNNSASPNGWQSGVMLPSGVEPTGRMMMGAVKRWVDRNTPTVSSAGTANAQTLTYQVAPDGLVVGQTYEFIAGATNTGAMTLNINGLGAKNVVDRDGNTLTGNEITTNRTYRVYWGGTVFRLRDAVEYGPVSYSPTDQSGAGLTFSSVSVNYSRIGNRLTIYGTLTYPTTANANNATISLPVAVPNQNYAVVPGVASVNVSVANAPVLLPVINTSTAVFRNASTASAYTNANFSGAVVRFVLTYPVT